MTRSLSTSDDPPRCRRRQVVAAAVLLLSLSGCSSGDRQPPGGANIVLILIDTLRADHLGCYGYARDTSPHIDRLAARGVVFEHSFAVAPWTTPAITTLFTGRYPRAVFPPMKHRDAVRQTLPEELETVAERLQDAGYRTLGLMDHPGFSSKTRFDQGFEDWLMLYHAGGFRVWKHTDAAFVLEQVEIRLTAVKDERFFLYLHLVYPHRPYSPPAPYDTMFGDSSHSLSREHKQQMINAYDGEIRYTDELVGEVVATLGRLDLLESTYLVITSDHGEAFWEHEAAEHGRMFFNEVTRVPLVIVLPESRPPWTARVEDPVSAIDLPPTLLAMAGLEAPGEMAGRSLFRLRGTRSAPPDWLFIESPHSGKLEAAAVVRGDFKYMQSTGKKWPRARVHDLRQDPGERHNLIRAFEDRRSMVSALRRHKEETDRQRAGIGGEDIDLDSETVDRLEALGYVQDP